MQRNINFVLFIYMVGISLFLPAVKINLFYLLILITFSFFISIYLYLTDFKLFVPTLFFLINIILNPVVSSWINKLEFKIPQIHFLLPIILYMIIVLNIDSCKKEITWWRWGKFDRTTIFLMLMVILLSSLSLFLWTHFIKQNLNEYLKFIPDFSLVLIILYGIAFPFFNSIFEEFLARAVLYDGFLKIFNGIIPVIFCQALVFALWHYSGFPGGTIGVVMVFIWSIFLGIIRYRSNGMFAPLITHFFADFSIALILFFLFIMPNK